jgi:hypothetical protein
VVRGHPFPTSAPPCPPKKPILRWAYISRVCISWMCSSRACISCVCLISVTSRACISFTSLPCAQDTGGENPCIDTKDVLRLLVVGDSAVRLLVTLERAPRGEKLPKRLRRCSNALGPRKNLHGRAPHRRVRYGHTCHWHASHRRVHHGRASYGAYLIGVHLTGGYPMGVHFMGVHHRMQPSLPSRTYVFAAFGAPGLMLHFSFWRTWHLGSYYAW